MCWVVRLEAQDPISPTPMKYEKIFLRRLPLSRFLTKTLRINALAIKNLIFLNVAFEVESKLYLKALRVNEIAMKSFSKNLSFGVDVKL